MVLVDKHLGPENECIDLLSLLEKGHRSTKDDENSPPLSIDEAESESGEEIEGEAVVQSANKPGSHISVSSQAVPKNTDTNSNESDKSPTESE